MYTAEVVAEVKRRRQARDWSAEQLAAEMAAVGVPWTRDTVVNLETGRRKRIAAHEVLALAFVLAVESPVDLMAPLPPGEGRMTAVTPSTLMRAEAVRAWFERQAASPRLGRRDPEREDVTGLILSVIHDHSLTVEGLDDVAAFLRDHVNRGNLPDPGPGVLESVMEEHNAQAEARDGED